MCISPNTVSSRKYRLFQEGERERLNLPSSCIEWTFWFSSHGDEAGIYAIYEQTNPRWCTMMCKIEPVYKVVKSRKMRSLTRRVDFIFGFCIKSWSRTHAISGIDHHWVMLSCYRDDSCRVGASFVRDRVSVFVARPAGLPFFEMITPSWPLGGRWYGTLEHRSMGKLGLAKLMLCIVGTSQPEVCVTAKIISR